ncbi:MAG: NUDIX domain-containing protein [Gemmatimonadota bacterium]
MPTRVLACVLRRANQVLICRRPAHKRHGDLWEFPGGKVEPGESDLEAAQRELAEELGLDVTAVRGVAFSVTDPGSEFVIEFLDVEARGAPQCLEHSALAWPTVAELLSYELAPSDRRFAEWLLSRPNPGAPPAGADAPNHRREAT